MRTPARLFNLDTVMIDVMMKVVALPQRGSDTLASEHLVTTGGGFNVMSAAARHGMAVVYAGQLGSGPFADIAREALRREGIDAPVALDPSSDVGFCLVLVDQLGERTFVTSTGAELHLVTSDLEALPVAPGDYVFVSGYNVVYPEIARTVTAWLEELARGVRVVFDPGPRISDIPPSVLRSVLSRTDWLVCNAPESRALSGETTLLHATNALLAITGRCGVVVRDGADGCWVATRELAPVRVAGFVVDVVDTNGAGDTHSGVLMAELARGGDVVTSARRANAAAAMAIGRLGPATCPPRDDVARWLTQFVD